MLWEMKTEFHTGPPQMNIRTSRIRTFCEEEQRAGPHIGLLYNSTEPFLLEVTFFQDSGFYSDGSHCTKCLARRSLVAIQRLSEFSEKSSTTATAISIPALGQMPPQHNVPRPIVLRAPGTFPAQWHSVPRYPLHCSGTSPSST